MTCIAVVARTLWLRRNGVVHGRIFSHPTLLVSKALNSLKANRSANSCQRTRPDVIPIPHLSWQGPLEGFVKVNWDAAVDKENWKMGIGAIIQNFEGKVLATLSTPRDYITDPVTAEATTTWRAVFFFRDLGYQRVELEGDALQVV
jgi:hypothetical protein